MLLQMRDLLTIKRLLGLLKFVSRYKHSFFKLKCREKIKKYFILEVYMKNKFNIDKSESYRGAWGKKKMVAILVVSGRLVYLSI